jgi:hypothetical protein
MTLLCRGDTKDVIYAESTVEFGLQLDSFMDEKSSFALIGSVPYAGIFPQLHKMTKTGGMIFRFKMRTTSPSNLNLNLKQVTRSYENGSLPHCRRILSSEGV